MNIIFYAFIFLLGLQHLPACVFGKRTMTKAGVLNVLHTQDATADCSASEKFECTEVHCLSCVAG